MPSHCTGSTDRDASADRTRSIALANRSPDPGKACAHTFSVMLGLAWPTEDATALTLSPAASNREMTV